MQKPGCRVCAGRKHFTVPGTRITLHPSQDPFLPAALLCLYLLVAYGAIQYLKAARQRQAELTDAALTPESIIGTSSEWQSEASTADQGQGVPQGDASSLPVNRSMQQPREQELKYDTDALFSNIQDIQQKLYGSEAAGEIQGKRDLATAAAEIDRCESVNAVKHDMQGTKNSNNSKDSSNCKLAHEAPLCCMQCVSA